MPRLELFRFRYRDRVTGKWVKAPTSLNDTRSLHGTASGRSPGPGRSGTSIRAHAISRHGRSCRTPSWRKCRNCRRRCSRTLLSRLASTRGKRSWHRYFFPDTSHTTGGEGHMHKCKGPHDYFAA